MRGRLTNLAMLASLLLALASAVMWARSQSVYEAWESSPRFLPVQDLRTGGWLSWGWTRYYVTGSSSGRFVFARYEVFTDTSRAGVTPGRGYVQPAPVSIFNKSSYALWYRGNSGTVAGWLPGIEWAATPRQRNLPGGGRWFVSVSWVVFVVAGSILPAVRAWGRWHQSRKRAFPVLPPVRNLEGCVSPVTGRRDRVQF